MFQMPMACMWEILIHPSFESEGSDSEAQPSAAGGTAGSTWLQSSPPSSNDLRLQWEHPSLPPHCPATGIS